MVVVVVMMMVFMKGENHRFYKGRENEKYIF
jgi:hypothetical protein